MTAFQRHAAPTLIAILLTSTAAHADVTAQQVWDDWKTQLGTYGDNAVTVGSESLANGVLTVSDITVAFSDDTGGMTGDMGDAVFTELGDGTVAVTMSENLTFAIRSDDGMGTITTMNMTVTQTDLSMLVSGTPEAQEYAIEATRYAFALSDMATNGTPMQGDVVFGMNDLSGTYSNDGAAGPMAISYAVDAASLDFLVDVIDSESGADINLSGKVEDLSMTADGVIPMDTITAMGMSEDQAFPPELAIAAGYSFGASNFVISVVEDGMPVDASATIASGEMSLTLDETLIALDMSTTGLDIAMNVPPMPVPVTIGLAEYGLGFAMPLAPGEQAQEFGLGFNLTDLVISDEIWSMMDPGAILPRDPASILLDLTGTMTVMANLMDPAAQQDLAMNGTPPALPVSLDLNALLVRFGGAEVTGTGAFAFDATDMTTYPGTPLPVGTVDLAINGVNGLMDRLVQMGLIPDDQVMMGRMMLGMFAVPVGDDMLTSTIEFTPTGGILANGNPIQ